MVGCECAVAFCAFDAESGDGAHLLNLISDLQQLLLRPLHLTKPQQDTPQEYSSHPA